MLHLDAGELRLLYDEPQALSDERRLHARDCTQCRAHGAAIADDARFAQRYLGENDVRGDERAAYERFSMRRRTSVGRLRPLYLRYGAVAAAAAIIVALFTTPLGGYANAFLTIFQPKQFATVDVTTSELHSLRALPQLDKFGTIRVERRPKERKVASQALVRQIAGFAVRFPQTVPPALAKHTRYSVQSPGASSFTFSAVKARAYAARARKTLPPMPPNLNGTAVRMNTGPLVVAVYGTPRHRKGEETPQGDFVTVVQMVAPRLSSTGASLQELESYILAMPGVSPELAAQIRALGDPAHTLPIPIRPDKQTAQQVNVDGVAGVAVGDNTGLGSGVVWEKGGIIYGVAGTLAEDDVLKIANGLR